MSFSGKATYSAGVDLPEIGEDVSDIVGIVSPYETPLLDYLGDAQRSTSNTIHEWLEDELISNIVNLTVAIDANAEFSKFDNNQILTTGDLLKADNADEVLMVKMCVGNSVEIARGYGGTPTQSYTVNTRFVRIGNAGLEGGDAPGTSFTNRKRKMNYTQIFTSSLVVSGSHLACNQLAISDEMDYQKQERLRELVRDLENCVINGVASTNSPQGSQQVRRTMNGIVTSIKTNIKDANNASLTEELLNKALHDVWESSSGHVDTILVNGSQKRKINSFLTGCRGYTASDTHVKDLVSVYESDFGVCRVIMSRWVPKDSVLLLDSSRIAVLPLKGRSFYYKPLSSRGDSEAGQVIGEYTLEFRNENAHGMITNLSSS